LKSSLFKKFIALEKCMTLPYWPLSQNYSNKIRWRTFKLIGIEIRSLAEIIPPVGRWILSSKTD
jgi:hypothetical protein